MITQKQIEASRARAKALDDVRDKAIAKAEAAWGKHDDLLTAYYRQHRKAEGKEGGGE